MWVRYNGSLYYHCYLKCGDEDDKDNVEHEECQHIFVSQFLQILFQSLFL